MIYLLLSILASTAIVIIFKLFAHWKVDTFQAIVCNYWVCVLCGWVALGKFPVADGFWEAHWFPYAIFLGFIFITGFNIVGLTVQKFSVTMAAVMQKMSMLLTVLAAVLFYGEDLNIWKVFGILAATISILLVNIGPEGKLFDFKLNRRIYLLLPILTLLSGAIIEIIFLHLEKNYGQSGDLQFVSLLFGTAGLLGTFPLIYGLARGTLQFDLKNVWAGILLGVPNFCSIYFLLKSLGVGWEGTVVFPVNNVSIIALSSLLAWVLFREQINKLNKWGVGCAILAILLIMIGG